MFPRLAGGENSEELDVETAFVHCRCMLLHVTLKEMADRDDVCSRFLRLSWK